MDGHRARDRFWLNEPLPGDTRVLGDWRVGRAAVRSNVAAGPGWGALTFEASEGLIGGRAGHFLMLGGPASSIPFYDPFLKYPFYLAGIEPSGGGVRVAYRARSRMGRVFGALVPGDELDYVGPVGRSFPEPAAGQGPLLLVGAEHGLAPLALAATEASRAGRAVTLVTVGAPGDGPELDRLGGPSAARVLPRAAWSAAEPGLREQIAVGRFAEAWGAGPSWLVAPLARACLAVGRPCFITVERPVMCAIGTCLGCTVPASGGGSWRACADGPILPAEEVIFDDAGADG